MRKQLMFLVVSLCALTAVGQTTFEPIAYSGRETIRLAGVGVALPDGHSVRVLRDSQGQPVEWRAKFPEVDAEGKRRQHLAYHQVLRTPAGEIALDGTELRLHYDNDDVLRFAAACKSSL